MKGAYTIQASFPGNASFKPAASLKHTVNVGSQAGYAILIEGEITNKDGLDSQTKTANRIYKSLRP